MESSRQVETLIGSESSILPRKGVKLLFPALKKNTSKECRVSPIELVQLTVAVRFSLDFDHSGIIFNYIVGKNFIGKYGAQPSAD